MVEAVVVADMALHGRLTTEDALAEWLAAHRGRKGVARLSRVIELVDPRAESPMESRLRLILVLGGLPRPISQPTLHDAAGRFLARPDLYYPQARLVVEFDGAIHAAPTRLAQDHRRQNRLLSNGFTILRFTGSDVLGNPEAVRATVGATLAAARRAA